MNRKSDDWEGKGGLGLPHRTGKNSMSASSSKSNEEKTEGRRELMWKLIL